MNHRETINNETPFFLFNKKARSWEKAHEHDGIWKKNFKLENRYFSIVHAQRKQKDQKYRSPMCELIKEPLFKKPHFREQKKCLLEGGSIREPDSSFRLPLLLPRRFKPLQRLLH